MCMHLSTVVLTSAMAWVPFKDVCKWALLWVQAKAVMGRADGRMSMCRELGMMRRAGPEA